MKPPRVRPSSEWYIRICGRYHSTGAPEIDSRENASCTPPDIEIHFSRNLSRKRLPCIPAYTSRAFAVPVFASIAFRAPKIPDRGGVSRRNGVMINAISMLLSRDSRA